MKHYQALHPDHARTFDTETLRGHFLLDDLTQPGKLSWAYTHYDRMMVGMACPQSGTALSLETPDILRADTFLARRELGILNLSDSRARIHADEQTYELGKLDMVFLGRESANLVSFEAHSGEPVLYMLSCPAHQAYPTALIRQQDLTPVVLGSSESANHRKIYKYLHTGGVRTAQLVMGLTQLEPGSVWNTMPTHVHDRRMEVYCYFDIPPGQRVIHLLGEPQQTRHVVLNNYEPVLSPPWSIHSGVGTANYGFVWGMAGENQDYADMDPVSLERLR